MDNNTVTDLKTGDVVPFMYAGEMADQQELPFEVDDTVNIPRNEYEELMEDSLWLCSLEEARVNNWEGYDEALRLFDEKNALIEEGMRD